MNAAETIQAAIDRLTELRDGSGAYKEMLGGDFQTVMFLGSKHDRIGTVSIEAFDGSEQDRYGEWRDSSAITLIRTLHRTIDAQLAILRHVLAHYRGDLGISTNRHVVDLAEAILGGDK